MADAEFAELFAACAAAVRRTAYLLCGDWSRAEDLTQTAFAKLYAAWATATRSERGRGLSAQPYTVDHLAEVAPAIAEVIG